MGEWLPMFPQITWAMPKDQNSPEAALNGLGLLVLFLEEGLQPPGRLNIHSHILLDWPQCPAYDMNHFCCMQEPLIIKHGVFNKSSRTNDCGWEN